MIKYKIEENQDYFFELDYNAHPIYDDNEFIAKMCAEDYYHEHDGWDDPFWPIIVYLYNDAEEFLGKFKVEIEYNPSFYSYTI